LKNILSNLPLILNAFVAVSYTALGIFILVAGKMLQMPQMYKTLLGVVILLYGIFRMYRFYLKYKSEKDEV
jgi:uncharacterized protein YhhL (DUF1145 family)